MLGKVFARWMLNDEWPDEAMLVPVPSSQEKMRERGFNPAEDIVRELSARTGFPFRKDLVVRHRHALPNSVFSEKRRREKNVRGVFSCEEDLNGKPVELLTMF